MSSSSMIRKYLLAFGVALGMSASVWTGGDSTAIFTSSVDRKGFDVSNLSATNSSNLNQGLFYLMKVSSTNPLILGFATATHDQSSTTTHESTNMGPLWCYDLKYENLNLSEVKNG